MKIWVLAPLLVFLFSFQTYAAAIVEEAETPILLTYEQFSHLTNAEQKTYVKKLREIMEEMSAAFPELAREISARSSFFAQMWSLNFQTALGEETDSIPIEAIESYVKYANGEARKYSQNITQTKISNLSEKEKGLLVEQYRQSLYWSASAAAQTYNITDKNIREQLLKNYVNPTKKKIEDTEERVKQFANEAEYSEARDQYFKKAHRGELLPGQDGFPSGALLAYGERLNPHSNLANTPDKIEVPKAAKADDEKKIPPVENKVENKKTENKDEKKIEKKISAKKNTATEILNTSNSSYYRCMYAGFILKNGPVCMAPSTLPWDLDGLDKKTFICENGTIMCNPFLFGFKTNCDWGDAIEKNKTDACMKSATPYCVKTGLYATKNCGSISNNESALQAAVQLINRNIAAFNQFGVSFGELCNKGLIDFNSYKGKRTPINIKKTKNDIKRTCDSARVRMAEIEKRFLVTKGSKTKKNSPSPAAEKASKNKAVQ